MQDNDFDVIVESSGHSAVRQIRSLNPDLLILDLGLPGKDGLEICREIRPEFQAPILILTARDSDMDHVLGLEFWCR